MKQPLDHGSLPFKVRGTDSDGNPIGVRQDGQRIALKPIDSSGFQHRLVVTTPTYIHRLYFADSLGEGADVLLQAAERLQEQFHAAGLTPKMGATYAATVDGSDESEAVLESLQAYRKAVRSMDGYQRTVVVNTVNYNQPAETMDGLLEGLTQLARHYRMTTR